MDLRGLWGESLSYSTPKKICCLSIIVYNGFMDKCILCSSKHHAKGYCYKHYWAYRNYGDANTASSKRGRPKGGGRQRVVSLGVNGLLNSKWGG